MEDLLAKLERPRWWPMVAAAVAAALLVGGVLYARFAFSSGDTVPENPLVLPPSPGDFNPPAPPPDAVTPTTDGATPLTDPSPMSDPGSPETECPLAVEPGRRRIRTTSATAELHGCYVLTLARDGPGCARVVAVVKEGSSSGPDCWAGDGHAASSVTSRRSDGAVVVHANPGGRQYTFELRSGPDGALQGHFRSSLGEDRDRGSLVEVPR